MLSRVKCIDDAKNDLRQLFERYDNALSFEDCRIAKSYLDGHLRGAHQNAWRGGCPSAISLRESCTAPALEGELTKVNGVAGCRSAVSLRESCTEKAY